MSSTDTLFLIFLATGLTVGFGHCVGMCGPMVVSLSLSIKNKGMFLPHLFYHGGRITTYGMLGGIMGWTGAFTQIAARITSFQKGAMIFAGLVVMVMGLAMSGWIPLGKVFRSDYSSGGIIAATFRKLASPRSMSGYFPLGLVLGLLPCGPVYTALIAAAGFGMDAPGTGQGFLKGMTLMVTFGIGTVPALFLVAKLAQFGWLKSRQIIYRISAVLMVLVGIYFVIRGIRY